MDNNVAYYVGYYGAGIFLTLCLIAAIVSMGKWIWRMIRPKR